MQKRKLIISMIFLAGMLVIGAASASDINETSNELAGVDDAPLEVGEALNSDILSSDEEEVLSTGEGSFEDIQAMIDVANDGDIITLSKDYISSGTKIDVNKEITIDGKNATLDAKGVSGIFDVTASNVVIKNINFRNGNFSDSQWGGGAILWWGENGNLDSCSFVNCSAVNGGAVYWYSGGGSLLNCSFADCFSESGAVYWGGDGGSLLNCNFVNCSAVNGGAVCWLGADGSVSDCRFKDCLATGSSGGAVHWYAWGTGGLLSDCSFVNCSSNSAGALQWEGADGTISGSSFVNCSAEYGGALRLWTDRGAVVNCTFENCSGSESGVIYLWGDSCNVSGCEFLNCFANHTGAIRWLGSNGSVSNCTFVNCQYSNDDRAVIYSTYKLNVSDTKFETSKANDICIRTNGGSISNSTINGILMNFFSDLQTLIDNADDTITLAQNYSGGGSPVVISKAMTVDGAGHTLDAMGLSRILRITASDVVIRNVNFINAKSDSDGGAIYWTGARGILTGCRFENCSADSGGAVYSSAEISNSTFVNCSARVRGALDGGNVFNCSFINCSSSYVDGAIRTEGTVSGCNFTNCSSYSHAGAIRDAKYILNCNFVNCHSYEWGGAISSHNSTILNCLFKNCTTLEDGGSAIICAYAFISDSRFVDCHANGGGSTVFCQYYGVITNCSFVNCSYNNHCGGALSFDYSGDVFDCLFVNCSAQEGGAIFMEKVDDANIENCRFINCHAVGAGGAITLKGDDGARVVNCSFVNCTTNGYGGGAIEIAAKNVIVLRSNFTFNTAAFGGAIIVLGENATINKCNFISNAADTDGGAVYWKGNDGSCLECSFINCSAMSKGGAIHWGGENGRIENSYFNVTGENTAIHSDHDLNVSKSRFKSEVATSMDSLITGANVLKCSLNDEPLDITSPQINVEVKDIELGGVQTVRVYLPSDAVGEVRFNLFNAGALVKSESRDVSDAFASCEFANLTIGVYNLSVYYSGDLSYNESTYDTVFVVRPKVTITQNVTVGEEANIYMELVNVSDDIIVIKIDGKIFNVADIEEGIVNFTFSTSKLAARNHTVTFLYQNDLFDANVLNYFDESANKFLPVEYELYISPKTTNPDAEVKNNNEITMWVGENATGVVKVFVNGAEVMIVKIVDGIARIDLSAYKDGNYNITFVYSGDDIYEGFTLGLELKNPKVSAKNTNALYTAGQKYSVTVYDKDGAIASGVQVIFKIGKKQVGKANTDSKGVATYKVTNVPGSYKITATALGVSTTKTLTVKHLVTLKSVTVKRSAKKLLLTATLAKVNKKYLKNKKITFKFNGKKYTAKTNKKGVAKVTIKSSLLKNLKVGKKVTYQATYLKDTVKKTVKVKK